MDSQLLHDFLSESEELIDALLGDVQALRTLHKEGPARRELVGRIFRHVHTLKGSASTIELEFARIVAHELESLLDALRMGRLQVNDAVLDAMDEAALALAEAINAEGNGKSRPTNSKVLETLQLLTRNESTSQAGNLSVIPPEISESLSEYERQRLLEAISEGANVYSIGLSLSIETFDQTFRNFSSTLSEIGEVVSTLPGVEQAKPEEINFRLLYCSHSTEHDIAARVAQLGEVRITQLAIGSSVTSSSELGSASEKALSMGPRARVVRVSVAELDDLIFSAHQLLAETSHAFDLARSSQTGNIPPQIEYYAESLRHQIRELEQRLIDLRMIPLASTLTRVATAGKAAAQASGKQINIQIDSSEVRLDKSLVDSISDPLLHLLRNAVDHGIEAPDERARFDKSPIGLLTLSAEANGGRVFLRVSDDGRGIDPERIRKAAVLAGIISPSQTLTTDQSFRLIFRPGFSTCASVSTLSGRGIGLDVVEKKVEDLGGEIRVRSEIGVGTTFEMVLPTSLSLVQGLVVRSNGKDYALDSSHVCDTALIRSVEILEFANQFETNWQSHRLPVVTLSTLLGAGDTGLPEMANAVISQFGSGGSGHLRLAAVVVDALLDRREILVKGLGRHSNRWHGVSGAAEIGDSNSILLLDLPRLLETHL